MKILVCANQKGGVTKTSTALHLATGAALRGLRSVLVDLDGQCNATEFLGLEIDEIIQAQHHTALDLLLGKKLASAALLEFPDRFGGNFRLIPGHPTMAQVGGHVDAEITRQAIDEGFSDLEAEHRKAKSRRNLRTSLESLEGDCDLVVVDTPPSLGFELVAALIAADYYVIPLVPGKFETKGLARLEETARYVKQGYNPQIEHLGCIVGRVRANPKLHKQFTERLQARFPGKVLTPFIRECIRFGECPYHGKTIFELVPEDNATSDFFGVVDSALQRMFNIAPPQSSQAAPVPARPVVAPTTTEPPVGEEVSNA